MSEILLREGEAALALRAVQAALNIVIRASPLEAALLLLERRLLGALPGTDDALAAHIRVYGSTPDLMERAGKETL